MLRLILFPFAWWTPIILKKTEITNHKSPVVLSSFICFHLITYRTYLWSCRRSRMPRKVTQKLHCSNRCPEPLRKSENTDRSTQIVFDGSHSSQPSTSDKASEPACQQYLNSRLAERQQSPNSSNDRYVCAVAEET